MDASEFAFGEWSPEPDIGSEPLRPRSTVQVPTSNSAVSAVGHFNRERMPSSTGVAALATSSARAGEEFGGSSGSTCRNADARNAASLDSGMLFFDTSVSAVVEGELLRTGKLFALDDHDHCLHEWQVLLFSTGIYAAPSSEIGTLESFGWSPFTEVNTLQMDGKASAIGTLPAFTLRLFGSDQGLILATQGANADYDCFRWVSVMNCAILSFSRSLFPTFKPTAEPLSSVPETFTRVLAGYLIREESHGIVSVPYCELHAHSGNSARFAMYEDSSCKRLESSLYIRAGNSLIASEKSESACFFLHGRNFSARSFAERKLWVKAIRNIRVKVQNHAPDPTLQELATWRRSVADCILAMDSELCAQDLLRPSWVPRRCEAPLRPHKYCAADGHRWLCSPLRKVANSAFDVDGGLYSPLRRRAEPGAHVTIGREFGSDYATSYEAWRDVSADADVSRINEQPLQNVQPPALPQRHRHGENSSTAPEMSPEVRSNASIGSMSSSPNSLPEIDAKNGNSDCDEGNDASVHVVRSPRTTMPAHLRPPGDSVERGVRTPPSRPSSSRAVEAAREMASSHIIFTSALRGI